ncbi:serine palmitoyltransferase 1 [Venturia canescens]|uniref:serine palmitoyltransferase 1 n=1 Tax=Venturia canescens TaxID=32260 RepID=UPI001C9BFB16|nr:serine palmitoyltransferase 1 [Venturia canescens]
MSSKLLSIESIDILGTIPQYYALVGGFLVLWLVWVIAKRRYSSNNNRRTPDDDEVERKLSNWYPEPLIPEVSSSKKVPVEYEVPRRVTTRVGKRIVVEGVDCLNLATHNYLGFADSPKIQENAVAAIRKYGVGSCGPRGFYGTVDVHLELEERLAQFMEAEEAIVYSYGFSAIASAIPAYCKRRDIVYADEKVNFAIQKGLDASRSTVKYFRHNDPTDLERLLKEQAQKDSKDAKKATKVRRFLIAEGIFMNTGLVCPLPQLVELCEKYKLRIFLDESISIGTLGNKGRGVTEHFNVPRHKIDMIMGSLEWSLSSIGGFCCGSSFVIEHQRLSGLGYCFSASLPPLLTVAATTALDMMELEPEIFLTLKKNCVAIDAGLRKMNFFEISGFNESPIKHIFIKETFERTKENQILDKISEKCIENGLAVIKSAYLNTEREIPRPSLRITVSVLLNKEDIDFFLKTLENCTKQVLPL